jgi:hypothetical protein
MISELNGPFLSFVVQLLVVNDTLSRNPLHIRPRLLVLTFFKQHPALTF